MDLEDPSYAETKAMELIVEAKRIQRSMIPIKDLSELSALYDQYSEKITQAISLLVLAKVQRGTIQA